MGRITIRVRGKATEALSELSKRLKLSPTKTVEQLLMQNLRALHDDEICRKRFFRMSIVYVLELPFAFPYECELFEFQHRHNKMRVYLERVPKRYVINRLPFKTLATSIIELTSEDKGIVDGNEEHIARDKLNSKYSSLAYDVLRRLLINYRRIADDYYNIGVVEAPMNFEEFQKKVESMVILNQQVYTASRFMPVTERSFFSVVQPLEEQLRSGIVDSVVSQLMGKDYDFLSRPNEYLDAAIVSYYHEQWDLCVLQSVISMETATSNLVLNSETTDFYLKLRGVRDFEELKKNYRYKASGLPQKIRRFLFPVIEDFELDQVKSNLGGLMPLIQNKKHEDGVYDMRSKIVHEGLSIGKNEAEKAVHVAKRFLEILESTNNCAKTHKNPSTSNGETLQSVG